jgi:hypothetical protein
MAKFVLRPLAQSHSDFLMWHNSSCDHWHHLTPTPSDCIIRLANIGTISLRLPHMAQSVLWALAPSHSDSLIWHHSSCDHWHQLPSTLSDDTLQVYLNFSIILPRHPDVAHCTLWPLPPLSPNSTVGTRQQNIYWSTVTVSFRASCLSNNRTSKSPVNQLLLSIALCWSAGRPSFLLWNDGWHFVLLYWPLVSYQLFVFVLCAISIYLFVCVCVLLSKLYGNVYMIFIRKLNETDWMEDGR